MGGKARHGSCGGKARELSGARHGQHIKKQAIAKIFENFFEIFFEVFVEIRRKNSILVIVRAPWHVRAVERYALSKFQPPTTLGDHQNVEKTIRKKIYFFGFRKSVFRHFPGFWRESAFFSVKIIFLVKFCSRCTYSEVRATKKLRKSDLCCQNLASASHLGVHLGRVCRQLPANIRW